jgi:hypothetical protein
MHTEADVDDALTIFNVVAQETGMFATASR